MKDVCAVNVRSQIFHWGVCYSVPELDCSARGSGVSWKVTHEISHDRDSVNALHYFESPLIAGSVSGYRGLWCGRWEGERDVFMVGLEA